MDDCSREKQSETPKRTKILKAIMKHAGKLRGPSNLSKRFFQGIDPAGVFATQIPCSPFILKCLQVTRFQIQDSRYIHQSTGLRKEPELGPDLRIEPRNDIIGFGHNAGAEARETLAPQHAPACHEVSLAGILRDFRPRLHNRQR